MKTFRISNGDVFIDEGTGSPEYVEGIEKGAQDVAGSLLTEFDEFFDEGNELLTISLGTQAFGLTESLVNQFLYESINRLIVKQRNMGVEDRIIKINQIKVRVESLTTAIFLVEVLFESGETASVVDIYNIRPVELDHLISPDAVVSI